MNFKSSPRHTAVLTFTWELSSTPRGSMVGQLITIRLCLTCAYTHLHPEMFWIGSSLGVYHCIMVYQYIFFCLLQTWCDSRDVTCPRWTLSGKPEQNKEGLCADGWVNCIMYKYSIAVTLMWSTNPLLCRLSCGSVRAVLNLLHADCFKSGDNWLDIFFIKNAKESVFMENHTL